MSTRGLWGLLQNTNIDKESWRGQCTKASLVHVLVARTASMDRQRGDWTIMPGPHSGIFYYALR